MNETPSFFQALGARWRRWTFRPQAAATAQVRISRQIADWRGSVRVGKNARLEVEAGVHWDARVAVGDGARLVVRRGARLRDLDLQVISGELEIGPGSRLSGTFVVDGASQIRLGAGCALDGVDIRIRNESRVELEDGCICDGLRGQPFHLSADHGRAHIAEKAHLQGRYFVRRNGQLEVGRYATIGAGTEVHCEESVRIGDYALISYGVMIFDTNSHSLNWKDRRRIIERGYPYGALERNRLPEEAADRSLTAPVVIGNDVWIGREGSVTKGCSIGDRSIVGLRTCVGSMEIPCDSIVVSGASRLLANKPPAPEEPA